jgi:hypothetical protein
MFFVLGAVLGQQAPQREIRYIGFPKKGGPVVPPFLNEQFSNFGALLLILAWAKHIFNG